MPTDRASINRQADAHYIVDCVNNLRCCSIVGLSNMGKSHMLRRLASSPSLLGELGLPPGQVLFVYIDFNLMLDISEQGFCELVLRSILTELELVANIDPGLVENVRQAYKGIVAPASPFAVALSFIEGIMTVARELGRPLVLLFDEFDECFTTLDGRVFLNLRALRDRYPQSIIYITATGQRLNQLRQDRGASEFAELFAHHLYYLRPLERPDAESLMVEIAHEETYCLSDEERGFLWNQAGGHPGLIEVSCRTLTAAKEFAGDALQPERWLLEVRRLLDNDPTVRAESAKLWNELSEEARDALMRFLSSDARDDAGNGWSELRDLGIVAPQADGTWAVFGELFRGFAFRQRLLSQRDNRGIRMDVEAGEAWVDGKQVGDLTGLEYRLLLLLYGNIDKICDKTKIVEAVWSESYLDEVDDARIEKLVSRLRQKIEPNPDEPQYLMTIRGRGYRLNSGTASSS